MDGPLVEEREVPLLARAGYLPGVVYYSVGVARVRRVRKEPVRAALCVSAIISQVMRAVCV